MPFAAADGRESWTDHHNTGGRSYLLTRSLSAFELFASCRGASSSVAAAALPRPIIRLYGPDPLLLSHSAKVASK